MILFCELAEHGVSALAVDLDPGLAREGKGFRGSGRAGVAEEAAKNIVEKVGEEGGFLELISAAGGNKVGPVLESEGRPGCGRGA